MKNPEKKRHNIEINKGVEFERRRRRTIGVDLREPSESVYDSSLKSPRSS